MLYQTNLFLSVPLLFSSFPKVLLIGFARCGKGRTFSRKNINAISVYIIFRLGRSTCTLYMICGGTFCPHIFMFWRCFLPPHITYFKYPEAVRRLIYTTNAIEGFNRQLRKVTKSKTVFPSDDSLLKMLYLATMDITKKWTGHRQDWGQIHSQLEIYFEERLIGRNL